MFHLKDGLQCGEEPWTTSGEEAGLPQARDQLAPDRYLQGVHDRQRHADPDGADRQYCEEPPDDEGPYQPATRAAVQAPCVCECAPVLQRRLVPTHGPSQALLPACEEPHGCQLAGAGLCTKLDVPSLEELLDRHIDVLCLGSRAELLRAEHRCPPQGVRAGEVRLAHEESPRDQFHEEPIDKEFGIDDPREEWEGARGEATALVRPKVPHVVAALDAVLVQACHLLPKEHERLAVRVVVRVIDDNVVISHLAQSGIEVRGLALAVRHAQHAESPTLRPLASLHLLKCPLDVRQVARRIVHNKHCEFAWGLDLLHDPVDSFLDDVLLVRQVARDDGRDGIVRAPHRLALLIVATASLDPSPKEDEDDTDRGYQCEPRHDRQHRSEGPVSETVWQNTPAIVAMVDDVRKPTVVRHSPYCVVLRGIASNGCRVI
mmetsp:Transcript_53020/g.152786  ORF Transcript_53020/g.152786 Transcript_53020/m.152786 type:complete len:432 (-) Transcript_53020:131-1426(-)